MKTGRDFPIGTMFSCDDYKSFWTIVSHTHPKGSFYMTLMDPLSRIEAYTIDQTIFNDWDSRIPKPNNFNSLYNKLLL